MESNELHFDDIAARVAQRTNVDIDTAKEFLSAVISSLTDGLNEGRFVEVKHLGTFALNVARDNVRFTPSKALTDIVNSAFAYFEPVVLARDFPDEENNSGAPEEHTETKPLSARTEVAESGDDETGNEQVSEGKEATESDERSESAPDESSSGTDNVETEVDSDVEWQEEIQPHSSTKIWLGVVIGLLCGLIIGIFVGPLFTGAGKKPLSESTEDVQAVDSASAVTPVDTSVSLADTVGHAMTDSATTVPLEELPVASPAEPIAETKPKEVYDTILPGKFLTRIARKHYGGKGDFWIYIYIENEDKISNPENIPVGTVLVIPPAEKYDIDAHSPQSVKKAKLKAWEYMRKWQEEKKKKEEAQTEE